MRTGRHEGQGRPILPPMPYPAYRQRHRRGPARHLRLPAVAAADPQPGAAADRTGRGANNERAGDSWAVANGGRAARGGDRGAEPVPGGACRAGGAAGAAGPAGAAGARRSGCPRPACTPRTDRVAPDNRPFPPQYPLWTDGADKARWIHLPQGARIDVADVDAWRFPVGTKLWKEFAWGGRKVETRLMWQAQPDFVGVRDATSGTKTQTDAVLAPDDRRAAASCEVARRRAPLDSRGRNDCVACHGTGARGGARVQRAAAVRRPRPAGAPRRAAAGGRGHAALAGGGRSPRAAAARPGWPCRRASASRPRRARRARLPLGQLRRLPQRHRLARAARAGRCCTTSAGDPFAPEPAPATAVDAAGRWTGAGRRAADSSRMVAPGAPRAARCSTG